MIRWSFALLLLCCAAVAASAQFRIAINLRNPPPAEIATWRDDPGVATVVIEALDRDYDMVYLGIEIINVMDNNVYARSRMEPSMRSLMGVRRNIPITLSGSQIIETRNIDYPSTLETRIATTGILPEGQYLFCVRLYDRSFRELTGAGTNNCQPFSIVLPTALQLRLPLADAAIQHTVPNVFSWTPVTMRADVPQYRLVIAPVFEGQVALNVLQSAFDRVSPTVVDVTVPTTEYLLQPFHPVLLQMVQRRAPRVTGFAWQVQALGMNGRPIALRGSAQGKSDYRMFTLQDDAVAAPDCRGPMTLENIFPAAGDTVPWLAPHCIVEWGPFCDGVRSMDYTLSIQPPSGAPVTNQRLLRWDAGVLESQGIQASAPLATLRARRIVTNWRDNAGGTPALNARLRRGETYRWSVDATFDRGANGRQQRTTTPTSFTVGLRTPQEPSPANDARVDATALQALTFTIPPPQTLQFTPSDLHTVRRSDMRMEFGLARERCRIVLSQHPDCSAPMVQSTRWLGRDGGYTTGEAEAETMFGRQELALTEPLAAGTYYWRVEYLDWSDGDRVYRQGPVWRFVIERTGVDADECVRLTAAAPAPRATVSDGIPIRFSVSTNPVVRLEAIRGGTIRVWEMSAAAEAPSNVRRRPPVVERRFSGNDAGSIVAAPGLGTSTQRSYFNLPFMDGALTVRPHTSYLWECTLDVDGGRLRADGVTCRRTQIVSSDNVFTVGATTACSDPCLLPPSTVLREVPAARTFAVGDVVTIGQFRARLTTVSGTAASGLRGEAVVTVPILRGGVSVSFENLAVNDDGVVYRGEMQARMAPASPVPAGVANALDGALGLNRDQLGAIWSLAADSRRLTSGFLGSEAMTMPIGFDRVVEGERFVVGIMGMVFKPRDARLNVVISVPLPWLGPDERLGAGLRNVCFHPNGFGREIEVGLTEDLGYTPSDRSWSFHFLGPRTADAARGVVADSGTYIRFGCLGFEALRVKAEVRFPRTWMIPVAADGRDAEGLVRATLATTIRRGGNFLAEATMGRFRPADVPDFIMEVRSLVVDMSDTENGSRMSFPSGYRGDMTRAWRGFFIDSLTMRLPDAIRTFDSTRPVQVDLRTMLIDRTGFSMQASVRNVIQYPRGNFGSWGASLDTLHLGFVSSSFSEGRMTGRLKVPISDSVLDYRASLSLTPAATGRRVGFQFVIQPRGTINAPLWIANLELAPTSRITMETDAAGQFRAIANFSGMLTIAGDAPRAGSGSTAIPGLNIRGVRFDDLRFQTHAEPYVSLRSLALASPQHGAAGFPVSFTGFGMRSGNRSVGGGPPMPSAGLQLGARVSLQRGAEAIGGDTRLTLWGSLRTTAGAPPQFVFGGVDLDEIGIDADMKAVRVVGRIQFFSDDARYGNGFRGSVSATFVKLLQVDATVQFGTTTGPAGFPYWYVDARGVLQRGIPIMSGIALYGFGGGAWYNMRRDLPTDALGRYTVSEADRALLQGSSMPTVSTAPGGSPTGITYVPDRPGGNDALGLYALVSIGTHPKADAFNADLRLTAEFSTGPTFGIRTISLDGQGYMMASLTERTNAPVTMNALIHWDVAAERLNGSFGIRVRYPQTQPKLFADGTLDILISRTAWHIKLGAPAYTPNERIRLSLGGDGLDASNALLSLNAYLMAGTNLQVPFLRPPAFPEDLWSRLQGRLTRPPITADRGDGFAFGASMAVTPPELQFLVFYANFRFVAGLDLSMLNVGRQSCVGRDAIGANGWYSRGQLYAYISGGVGLKADLGFWEGKLELASITMASILEGGTPNPMWLTGAVEGWYSVLGGALQGSFNFQFAVGERCVPARDVPLPLNVLTGLTPEDGRTDVSAIAQPTATSTYRFNEPFDMIEMYDGQRIAHTYRVVCDGFHVAPTDNPAMSIAGTTTIDAREPSIVRNTLREVHQYDKEYLAIVTARVEKAQPTPGLYGMPSARWFTATNPKTGALVREQLLSTYRTERRPDTIAPEQVWNTYPRNRQRFFLQDECREGFIRMAGSYGHLFGAEGGVFNEVVIRFQEMPGGPAIERPVTYVAGRAPSAPGTPQQPVNSGGSLTFPIPTLRNGTLYSAQIVRRRRNIPVPTGTTALGALASRLRSDPSQSTNASMLSAASDAAQAIALRRELVAARTQQFQQAMGTAGTVAVRQTQRTSALDEARTVAPGETLVFLFFFRTSQYNTLASKVSTLQQRTATVITSPGTNIALLRGTYAGPELFDRHDVEQVTVTVPSIPQPGGGGLDITLPPLLAIGATGSSVWHQTFAQAQVLARIDAMRPMWPPLWSPNLWTQRIPNEVRMNTGSEYFYVETSASASSLTDAELSVAGDPRYTAIVRALQRTFTTRSQVLSGQSSGYAVPTGSTPTAWQITYDYPFWLCLDWGTMRQRATYLRSMGCMELLGNQRCADLQTWANTPFQLPGRGTYEFWLRYNSPCAVDPDYRGDNQRRFMLTIP